MRRTAHTLQPLRAALTRSCVAQFKGIDQEFDGGDSGGGVVGDGNTDLEDQHNSATLGALRGGISDVGTSGLEVGRGNVMTYADLNDADEFTKDAEGATSSVRAAPARETARAVAAHAICLSF